MGIEMMHEGLKIMSCLVRFVGGWTTSSRVLPSAFSSADSFQGCIPGVYSVCNDDGKVEDEAIIINLISGRQIFA